MSGARAVPVLLVEDDPALGTLIAETLAGAGVACARAASGAEALAALAPDAPERPRLLLLDYSLPDMTADALLDALAARGPLPAFVVVTGVGDERIAVAMMKRGALDYLVKDSRLVSQLPGVAARALRDVETRERLAEAESARRLSDERLRTLIDAMPDIVRFKDGQGRLLEANAFFLRLFGLEGVEYRGRTEAGLAELAGEAYRPAFLCCAASDEVAWERRAMIRGELRVPDGAGGDLVFDMVKIPMYHPDGSRKGLVIVGRDITSRIAAEEERRRLEAQMRQAQKLESLGVMAGGIAHDFNNLLMAVLGQADLALDGLGPDSACRNAFEEIAAAARRAAELTGQLLAYAGQGKTEVRAVDLAGLVEEMGRILAVSVSRKATISYRFATGVPAVEGDPGQLRQVAMNLILNASDALGDGPGSIVVRVDTVEAGESGVPGVPGEAGVSGPAGAWPETPLPAGRYVCLEVADTGVGMDEATRARIFDPFFTTKFTGRGLGLAAVLGIVRGHRGAIAVESEPGRGSVFRVWFPATAARPVREAAPAPGAWRGSGTVLIVDDEEVLRSLGTLMLKRLGFDSVTAADGVEAVELFRGNPDGIACVVLDLTMPRKNGEETLRELRLLRPDVRAVLASGYSGADVERRFAGMGFSAFLQKPYQLDALAAALRRALESPAGGAAADRGSPTA